MTNRMPELLCPAGNLESLEAALHFGADAGGRKDARRGQEVLPDDEHLPV